eukprot:3146887-Rhodomonas_salina.1
MVCGGVQEKEEASRKLTAEEKRQTVNGYALPHALVARSTCYPSQDSQHPSARVGRSRCADMCLDPGVFADPAPLLRLLSGRRCG